MKMSDLDWDRQVLDAVENALNQPPVTPEEEVEAKLDWILRELDEVCAMAKDPIKSDLVAPQKRLIGMIEGRIDLIIGFLLAKHPPSFRIVR